MSIFKRAKAILESKNKGSKFSMNALNSELGLYIVKSAALVKNSSLNKKVHSQVSLFCSKTGDVKPSIDGDLLTNTKCMGVVKYTSEICIPSDANTLSVFGSGIQAENIIKVILSIRNIKTLKLYSRNKESVLLLKKSILNMGFIGEIIIESDIVKAVQNVDVLVTATTSFSSLFESDLILNNIKLALNFLFIILLVSVFSCSDKEVKPFVGKKIDIHLSSQSMASKDFAINIDEVTQNNYWFQKG